MTSLWQDTTMGTFASGKWRYDIFPVKAWQLKEPGRSQPWYLPSSPRYFSFRTMRTNARRHYANSIFKQILLKENACNMIQISLKFVPKGLVDIKSWLIQVLACYPMYVYPNLKLFQYYFWVENHVYFMKVFISFVTNSLSQLIWVISYYRSFIARL